MIEDRYVELINKEIDGTNSPGESAKLRRHLQAYPGADNSKEFMASLKILK